MAKEQDCINYEPGFISKIGIVQIDNYLSRSTSADNQRRTSYIYIYADDNLLGGK